MGRRAATAPKRKRPRAVRYRNGAGGFLKCGYSDGANARGLRPLRALADLELDLLVLLKGAEARPLNLRVVDKNVGGAVIRSAKAEALLRGEPLHSSLWHFSRVRCLVTCR